MRAWEVTLDRTTLLWIALVGGSLVTGASLVGVLVLKRSLEPLIALVGLLAFVAASGAFISISGYYGSVSAVLYGFAFIIASAGGGYALASSLLDRFVGEPVSVAQLTEGHRPHAGPAAVVACCIEPQCYEPSATAGMLQMLTDEGLLDASMGALPFVFFAQKARYRAVGGESPAHGELVAITEALHVSLGGWATLQATCGGPEPLPRQVMRLAEKGHDPIIVAQLSIGQTGHLAEAKRQTDALHLDEQGVRVVYTDGLSDSDRVAALVTARVLRSVDDAPSTGVVLVGHGQPEERSRKNPGYDEDENRFLNRIRMQLTDQGLSEDNVRVAWAEWRTPNITSTVRHLAALGCRRVIVSPACFPLDTIATRLDIEIAVRQARVDDTITVVTLPAWADDPLLVEELRARIVAATPVP